MKEKTLCPKSVEAVSDEMAAVLRGKTPSERLRISFSIWEFTKRLTRSGVKQSRPDLTEDQVEQEVAKRMSCGAL